MFATHPLPAPRQLAACAPEVAHDGFAGAGHRLAQLARTPQTFVDAGEATL
jgi:hypothetical protein